MANRAQKVVYGLCGLAVVASIVGFVATGSKPYSRHEDEALSAMNEESDLGELFADSGDSSGFDEAALVESGYALGLLPSGPGIDSLSVMTVWGSAGVVAGGTFWVGRRKYKKAHANGAVGQPAALAD